MYLKWCITILSLWIFYTNALANDGFAVNNFELALSACERGLVMNTPKSRSSLKVLQNLLKKYRRKMESALKRQDDLHTSTHQYQSEAILAGKTFAEAYAICEQEFTDKVTQAEIQIAEELKERQLAQKQQMGDFKEAIQKNAQAKKQALLAINDLCLKYLADPIGPSSPLYPSYQQARQKALELYPNVAQQYHIASLVETATGKQHSFNWPIAAWFEHCDRAFQNPTPAHTPPNPAEDAGSQEGPMLPTEGPALPATTPKGKPEEGNAPPSQNAETDLEEGPQFVDETANSPPTPLDQKENGEAAIAETEETVETETTEEVAGEDEDLRQYQILLSTSKGDRIKILKREGRLPDFVDDEDYDYQKASIWQYELVDTEKCNVYHFKNERLVKEEKNLAGACPPLGDDQ